ncbi:Uncharacterized [Syntrophomonas zehnderi OL-4]|uniref:Uncharacterized n=1 Tax=Syntrophomonas zehnderi OL-4 TaxID=690567 RepID=A0A0E4G9B2_9FIRM|nr:hypothetical protein [Syntrophomonas zehnderi]CFX11312.1 Uncharacterized [Syntrophomonas zehnderi OL-4]
MLELDFAFLNMMAHNRQGLAARKYFLDRLAPFLYSPRIEHLIYFGDLGVKGCNIFIPLGEGNFKQLEAGNRALMLGKSEVILREYDINKLAADRSLKNTLAATRVEFPLFFGDQFINALAAVLVRQVLELRDIKKLILIGDMPELMPLLENLSAYQLPISVQNINPTHSETTAYQLLYAKGLAVTNSYISPQSWKKDDLIMLFESRYKRMTMASPQRFYIELTDDSQGLAPSLEMALSLAGLDNRLKTLAPILESCLYAQAGISKTNTERKELDYCMLNNGEDVKMLIARGDEMGIWEPFLFNRPAGFLDKGIGGLYNTIKD